MPDENPSPQGDPTHQGAADEADEDLDVTGESPGINPTVVRARASSQSRSGSCTPPSTPSSVRKAGRVRSLSPDGKACSSPARGKNSYLAGHALIVASLFHYVFS